MWHNKILENCFWGLKKGITRAEGAEGEAKRRAETAPKGATVIESPFGVNNWSNFPNIAIAANAPNDFFIQKKGKTFKGHQIFIQKKY